MIVTVIIFSIFIFISKLTATQHTHLFKQYLLSQVGKEVCIDHQWLASFAGAVVLL